MTELDPLISVLSAHPKLLADSKVTFHRIAQVLRWAADVLDAAPKVAGDLKAGDLPKAVQDLPQAPAP